jgi:hypothetical protein
MTCRAHNYEDCPLCHPGAKTAPLLSVQCAKPAEPGFDVNQVVELFKRLDARGQALTWALMQAADRLQGKRG